jgi:hypothetical protein
LIALLIVLDVFCFVFTATPTAAATRRNVERATDSPMSGEFGKVVAAMKCRSRSLTGRPTTRTSPDSDRREVCPGHATGPAPGRRGRFKTAKGSGWLNENEANCERTRECGRGQPID